MFFYNTTNTPTIQTECYQTNQRSYPQQIISIALGIQLYKSTTIKNKKRLVGLESRNELSKK